jgi:hypothetical protein
MNYAGHGMPDGWKDTVEQEVADLIMLLNYELTVTTTIKSTLSSINLRSLPKPMNADSFLLFLSLPVEGSHFNNRLFMRA